MKTRFTILVALALARLAASLDAQVSYIGDLALPSSHAYIPSATGLVSSSAGLSQLLVTLPTAFRLDSPVADYTVQLPSYPPGTKLITNTLVAFAGPSSPVVYMIGAARRLYAYNPSSTVFISSLMDLSIDPATTNTLAASGTNLALALGNQIYSVSVVASYPYAETSTLRVSSGANGGPLGTLGRGAFGPDGLYYTLDQAGGVTRVESYNLVTGAAENAFTVPSGTSLTAGLAISPTGHLYLGDGSGGLSEYDLSGDHLGDYPFTGSGTVDLTSTGGVGGAAFLSVDAAGDIFVYDPGTGMHVYYDASGVSAVPEPAAYAAVAGALALGLAAWRRAGRIALRPGRATGGFSSAGRQRPGRSCSGCGR